DTSFDWEDDRPPARAWNETIIYEAQVKGFTKLNEHVREDLRGTYAGLASEPALEYLRSLAVTAVELLPIHHIADEALLIDRGLTNYWGYSSIGYLAPHALYAAMATASASTSPPRLRASSMRSTACRPSSTSSTRTPSSPR